MGIQYSCEREEANIFENMSSIVAFIFLPILFQFGKCGSWNYDLQDSHGPNHWGEAFSTCSGDSQSPVDIPRTGLPKVTDFPPLKLDNYDMAPEVASIKNNGHSAKMSIIPVSSAKGEQVPLMSGGGLEHDYKFAQAHFHWGADESKGSEHQKSSTSFPMEMHLVHYKAVHSNIVEALEEGAHDSLAVLGVFFSVQLATQVDLPSMDLLTSALANITQPHTDIDLDETFPLSDLLPKDLSGFYRYNGSLTTPTCNQIVQWTVLKKPVFIKLDHLIPFRELLTSEGTPLVDNFRPVQPLGSRQILDVTTSDQDAGAPIQLPIALYDSLVEAKFALKTAQESVDNALEAIRGHYGV